MDACVCAGATLCAQGACSRHCEQAAGRWPEPSLSTCHERHPKVPAAKVSRTYRHVFGLCSTMSVQHITTNSSQCMPASHCLGQLWYMQIIGTLLAALLLQGCLWQSATAASCAGQLHGGLSGARIALQGHSWNPSYCRCVGNPTTVHAGRDQQHRSPTSEHST